MDPTLRIFTTEVDTSLVRQDTFMGREHLVVPVVALVQGVIHPANSSTPELALAQEFGKVPQGWNGRPLVMNHPIEEGVAVIANSPRTLEDWSFGHIFNSHTEDNKLKTEAWIDLQRAADLGGEFQDTVDRINNGDVIEISVGFFADIEKKVGQFNGKKYSGVYKNFIPDHLAFLSDGVKGACSVEGGCGAPRINSAPNTACDCGCGGSCGKKEAKMPTAALYRKLVGVINASIPDTILDMDARRSLSGAIQKDFGGWSYLVAFTDSHAIFQNFDTNQTMRVAFDMDEDGNVTFTGDPEEVRLMTRVVSVTASGEEQESTPGSATSALLSSPGPKVASPEDLTTAEANASEESATPAKEVTVTEQTTEQPRKPETAQGGGEQVVTAPPVQAPAAADPEPIEAQAPAAPKTLEQYVEEAPADFKNILAESLRVHNERKESVIKALQATNRCGFSPEVLAQKSLEELEQLAKLAGIENEPKPTEVTDFSARPTPAPVPSVQGTTQPEYFAPPPPAIWPAKQQAAS